MAHGSSPNDSSTRWVETARGILSYSELAPLLGEAVFRVQQRIESGAYAGLPLSEDLICAIHGDFSSELFPEWGGKFRSIQVRVGAHDPPPPHRIRLEMRAYIGDLNARLGFASDPSHLPELLAFAEGRLLTIHPFADFNGRLVRLWLWELLRRLALPPVELAPTDSERVREYLAALRAADESDWVPLQEIWISRLAAAL